MKKRLALAAAAALGACLVLPAAEPTPTPAEARATEELMQLERDIGRANVERDAAFFERVEADEFIFTDSNGGLTTKAEDVDGVRKPPNPDVKLLAYDVDEMQVRVYGDAAVVTGRATTRQLVKGEERSGRSRFTDVFVRRGGSWRIVAGHSSRIKT